jgi:hypothetical protein
MGACGGWLLLKPKKTLKVMQINGITKSPEEIRAWYFSKISKGVGYSNEEICRNSWKLDADYARGIYECCLTKPDYLEHYLGNEKALSRLLPAVLGAFSGKCALCGWDASRRSEIRKALKSAEGVMFPMPELEGWLKAVENKVRSCAAGHSGFQIWRLLRMLKVKMKEPKAAKIETAQYD